MLKLSVDDALTFCRTWAALSGDPSLSPAEEHFAQACERLLVEVALAKAESARYRDELERWGIPRKRAIVQRIERKGFEIGWES